MLSGPLSSLLPHAEAMAPRAVSEESVAETEASELFIGLVAATGTDADLVSEKISRALAAFGYGTHEVRLSALIRQFYPGLATSPISEYISSHQKAGNKLRAALDRADALALAAVAEIRAIREELTGRSGAEQTASPRTAYLIRSFKTPAEVRAFRDLYSDRFILISAHAPRDARVSDLARRIEASGRTRDEETLARSIAEKLVATDEAEEADDFGQNVRNAFPLADFFVDARSPRALEESIERCFDIFFGDPFRTPRRDEVGMYYAQAAAVRSAELGRQVGAAVSTPEGSLVAVGTNEVAKKGGGLYWEGDDPDERDFRHGEDTNEVRRVRVVEELLSCMKDEGWLAAEHNDETAQSLLAVLGHTRLAGLIEFGRAVHAEMAALTDAAMRGVSVRGCTLYSTTFPCHLCARHIVAAGIERLVYIHPYPKSLAAQLYEDSIAVDQENPPSHVIAFQPYVGIAPHRYLDLFTAEERKRPGSGGKAVVFERTSARPKFANRPFAELGYLLQEQVIATAFADALDDAGLKPTTADSTLPTQEGKPT